MFSYVNANTNINSPHARFNFYFSSFPFSTVASLKTETLKTEELLEADN